MNKPARMVLFFGCTFLVAKLAAAQSVERQNPNAGPILTHGGTLYADIDSVHKRVHVLSDKVWWRYDLQRDKWSVIDTLALSVDLHELEFGYNAEAQRIEMWSKGVGEYYIHDTVSEELKRIDKSHNHRNQHGHFPFFKDGSLYAFGGYGYWEWHNIMTFFNREVREWNIQNVKLSSSLPEARTPATGHYNAATDNLYIFGGNTTVGQHPDDMKASRIYKTDIWKFSFADERWTTLLEMDEQDLHFYSPAASEKVGRTNKVSSSFYIPGTGYWFIPVVYKNKLEDPFFLKPVHLASATASPTIELQFGKSKQFLPTNFFYDAADQSAVIVGIDYLTNANEYPVRIVRISKDSLSAQIQERDYLVSMPWYFYGLGLLFAVVGMLFLLMKEKLLPGAQPLNLPIAQKDLEEIEVFNDQEQKLLHYLISEEGFVEPHNIEELLWEEVDSYDYRRRLRNDLINSVNTKFQSLYSEDDPLVLRKKDPNDNRRYLYGLNTALVVAGG